MSKKHKKIYIFEKLTKFETLFGSQFCNISTRANPMYVQPVGYNFEVAWKSISAQNGMKMLV